jgi:hypothetical protein
LPWRLSWTLLLGTLYGNYLEPRRENRKVCVNDTKEWDYGGEDGYAPVAVGDIGQVELFEELGLDRGGENYSEG